MKRLMFIYLIQVLVVGYTFAQEKTLPRKDSLESDIKATRVNPVNKDTLRNEQLNIMTFDKKPFQKSKETHKFDFATSYIMGKEMPINLNKNLSLAKFNLIEKPNVNFKVKPVQQQIYFFAIYDCVPIPAYLMNTTKELQPHRDLFAHELRTIGYQPWSYDQDSPAILFFFLRKNKHVKGWGWHHLDPLDNQYRNNIPTNQTKPGHRP